MTIKIDVYLLWELFLLVTGLWVIRTAWFIGKLAVGRFATAKLLKQLRVRV